MDFKPVGGFPALIPIKKDIDKKTFETRSFGTTNIVNIGDIMKEKKKENLFIAFGDNEDEYAVGGMLETPHQYSDIEYQSEY